MSTYSAKINWKRNGFIFTDNKYSRAHVWHFDGGAVVSASSSPQIVPEPSSDPSGVDPEEAFLASITSCHMLWFLTIAAKNGYIVDEYTDDAEAIMEKNSEGKPAITQVVLHPVVTYSGVLLPGKEEDAAMHHQAHKCCFIANSVRSEIKTEPMMRFAD